MKQLLSAALVLALAPIAATQNDKIVWTDGTETTDCKIQEFTWREIKFGRRGRSDQRPADQVASIHVARAKQAYQKAYNEVNAELRYGEFRKQAEKLVSKDPLLAQLGFIEAAKLLITNGEYTEAFALLEKMVAELPDAGYYPELFRLKLAYYLPQGEAKARDAAAVAQKYSNIALQKGWPDGFVHEAAYFDMMARSVGGAIKPSTLQGELRGLLDKTEGSYPTVADRVRVQLADILRAEGRLDEARAIYEKLADKTGVDEAARASAELGLGHVHFAKGDPTQRDAYRAALLMFLRVFLNPAATDAQKAEALYHGAVSCEKWRGEDAGAMARRLRGYLRRDYPESDWASR